MTMLSLGLLAVLFVLSAGMVLSDAHAQVTDTTAPVTVAIVAIDANTIVLTASETLAGSSAATDFRVFRDFNGNIYTVAGNPVISENTVTITFSDDIASNRSAEVTYVGSTITDVARNLLPEFSFRFLTNAIGLDPRIGGVYATGGPYKAGDTFDIIIVFSKSVTVTGFPQLTLETGTNDAVVNYFSGSPGTSIAFRYTVAAGHNSGDLDYVSNSALALNGGTITATDGGANADTRLTTPTALDSISSNSDVIVDTEAPAFGSAATTDKNTIEITVTEPLDETMNAGIFTVPTKTVTGTTEISDNTITITVSTAIVSEDELTVSYTDAAAGGVTDVVGNALASFGPETVTNSVSGAGTITESDTPAISDATSLNISITHTDTPVISDESDTQIIIAPSGAPTVTITTDDAVNGGTAISDVLLYTVTFSETVRDFDDADDITLGGTASATVSAPTPDESSADSTTTYTFVVTADSDGTVLVSIPENAATDTAGNGNVASGTYTVTLDILVPVATFTDTIGSSGTDNGKFSAPVGIATTSTTILVTEFNNNRVQIFDLDGNYFSKFDGADMDNGEFNSPYGITTNSTRILVADSFNNRVQIFDLDGNYHNQFGSDGTGDGQFDDPRGITTTSTQILVADTFNDRVQVFDSDGNYLSQFGSTGSGDGQFKDPSGITTNSTHILVADTNNHRIQIFDLDGNYLSKFGDSDSANGDLNSPIGITATPTRILVTEFNNNRVQVFDPSGNYVSSIGRSDGSTDASSADGQFNAPQGITTNSTHILVADTRNDRVQVFDFTPTAVITTINSIGGIHNSDTVSYTVTFSEDVTGFDVDDIVISGTAFVGLPPAATNFAGSGNTYTFDVETTGDGTVKVVIPKLAVTDGVGGNNMASDTHTVAVDTNLFGIASAVWRDPDESDTFYQTVIS